MSEHGRIIAVTERPLGSTLVGDTAAGATTLTVVDAAEFDDQAGGWLSVNDQVIQYDKVDDDTGVITLTAGSTLSAAADEGDAVLVYDPLYQTIAVDKRADVILDGPDDNTDAIDAGIALHLVDKLDTGIRGDTGESVILEEEAGDWKIIDVLGLGDPAAVGVQFEDQDTFAIGEPGGQLVTLSHPPIPGSVHMAWNGLWQRHTDFNVDTGSGDVTIPDPTGDLQVGDVLDFRYAYLTSARGPFLIDWASPGWRFLPISASDTTDRSRVGLDDSSWVSTEAPFGDDLGHAFNYVAGYNWPAPATRLTLMTAVWLRRAVTGARGPLTVSVRVDNVAKVYWNGSLIGSPSSVGEYSYTVPASDVKGTNVLAVRVEDIGPAGTGNHFYADVRVAE